MASRRSRCYSGIQSPALVRRLVAQVLGCPMHQIEVEVPRLGGAFGGKEEQATAWAALAALAAHHLHRPVKLALRRGEDMRMTGKRHPYSADFRLGVSASGRLLAYDVHFYQDAGAVADLSPAVLERSMCHATGGYFIPNVRITAASCRTHLPPNTACRGFGTPQAVFIIESAIDEAAHALGVAPGEIQRLNLLQEGDHFPYGMQVRHCRLRRCWEEAERLFDLERKRAAVHAFNATETRHKKGLALLPLCFGISFSQTLLNQASALVHIYIDGSVSVSTGAVELGQGVRRKLQQLVAGLFALRPERIKVEPTNTVRIANMSPTAAR
ncbi:MAG: molybdopterin cofactor-binding domain-containing protein [Candidatus Competibacteraceae bacterium]